MSRDAPLRVTVSSGVLRIEIGVDTLAGCAERHTEHQAEREEPVGYDGPQVTDRDGLAQDVRRALEHEEEDGTTAVHLMLDGSITRAIEQGSEHVLMPRDAGYDVAERIRREANG